MLQFMVFAGLLLSSLSAVAQDSRLICPERVRVEGGTVVADLPSSTAALVTSTPQLLSSVSIFDGPPSEGAELLPTNAGTNAATIVWRIESSSPQGVWLACNYGSQVARVVMKAEGTPVRCEAQMTRSGSPRVLRASLSCKP
ncbi:STY0301 family protein [Roseateles sp. SL47]|uniref:STY0301 family protein n=1 Tax=Roseateles sp. SL47 TaxID=2995138 RepID=UPI003B636270